MTDDSRVEELLDDRPDVEAALAELREVDAAQETWTFDDVAVDSGTFGQLVSEGVVEKADGEYRLADPEAVRVALGEETADDSDDSGVSAPDVSLSAPTVNARAVGMLAGVLAVLVAIRVLSWGAVFRGEHVVLSGNDPYAYRFLVEQTLAEGGIGILPFGEVSAGGEPFLVATLAWLSGLFGGAGASGAVLAFYPVASAVFTAILLYGLAYRVTDDRRVGLAAVLMLAVTPGNAFRTSLGYADHHAFDVFWLTLTAFGLAAILTTYDRDSTDPVRWLAAVALGVGIAGQVLAWDNGPLLLVPVAAVVTLAVLLDLRADRSPLIVNAPVLAGIALAAVGTYAVHATAGWHSTTVALVPALLLVGSLAVVAVGELAARLNRSARELAVLELVASVGVFGALVLFLPDIWSELQRGLDRILRQDDIAEVQSLFSGDTLGFLLLFGFILAVALPALVWASARIVDDDDWLVPVVYSWYFFVLAAFQVRFVGELSPFTALFAGLGFVWLAAWVDLAALPTPFDGTDRTGWIPSRPDRSTVVALVALFLLVGGLGVVQSAVKINQVTIDDDSYETAAHISEYADERGWNASESYVFSDWGRNRMYNYFANGQSGSYGYAESNYREFAAQTDPDTAVGRVDGRVRFVVTQPFPVPSTSMLARLHQNFGSRSDDADGLSRYRAIYASESGDRKAFVVVPGATLNGTTAPNGTVTLTTDVSIPNAAFTYERRVSTGADGSFRVDVAYPGTYELSADGQTWTVDVPEAAVMNGTRVAADHRSQA